MSKIIFETENLHVDTDEVVPGRVICVPGEPLQIGTTESVTHKLPPRYHIALAVADPHVHFRESVVPSRELFAQSNLEGNNYDDVVAAIKAANDAYDVHRGSLAALKGGVWAVGAMGNTPLPPTHKVIWDATNALYREKSKVFTHVWQRMEPGVIPVNGQEGKDFGTTFGGSGLSDEARREMYMLWKGRAVSFHNDQPNRETIEEFRDKVKPAPELLHHLYFDGDTVLASQRETFALAREAGLSSIMARHIPTGPALEMVLSERGKGDLVFPAEIGLDYLYWNRDMLHGRDTSMRNYRRPALPSEEDQRSLIELTRDLARKRDPLTHIGSDHAPHTLEAKAFVNGLPGSPGTRVIEHYFQILHNLVINQGYTWGDVIHLACVTPAKYLARHREFPFDVGTMQSGAMANLMVFDPDVAYTPDEAALRGQLHDPHYHTAYKDEKLRGKVMFTVVNGKVFNVAGEIEKIN